MHWGQNVCRICGQISENCHLIYGKDVDNNIEARIKKCLKLQLFEDDFKPKQLCNGCLLKLDDFYNFVTLCHATDKKFEGILLDRQQWNGEAIIDYTQQKLSVIVTPKATIDQLDCNDIDLYKDTVLPLDTCPINEHEMLEIVENASTYTTLEDNLNYLTAPTTYDIKKFGGNDYYQESTVLRHSSNYQAQDNSCSSSVVINYSCQQSVHKDLGTAAPITEDLYQKGTDNFPDITFTNVGLDYSNYNARDTRVADEIEQQVSYPTYSTTTKTCNNKAKRAKPPLDKEYVCPHCDRKFKRRMTLNCHITAIHKKLRPYVCDICKKSYAVKCDLTSHKKIHTDCHKCKFCSSAFTAPSKLQRHLFTHTKDRPFVCDTKGCDRSFSDKRNLDAHKISLHSVDYQFSCNDCGKVFKSKNRLKQHSEVHRVRAPFSCDICFKSYKYKCTLMRHLDKHNGYICPYCKKDYERFAKLFRHKKVCTARAERK